MQLTESNLEMSRSSQPRGHVTSGAAVSVPSPANISACSLVHLDKGGIVSISEVTTARILAGAFSKGIHFLCLDICVFGYHFSIAFHMYPAAITVTILDSPPTCKIKSCNLKPQGSDQGSSKNGNHAMCCVAKRVILIRPRPSEKLLDTFEPQLPGHPVPIIINELARCR